MINQDEVQPRRVSAGTKSRKTSRGGKKRPGSVLLIWVVVAAVIVIGAGTFGVFCMHSYSGPERWIHVPEGSTAAAVNDSVESALGSGEATRVKLLWTLMGGKAEKAKGAYRIEPGMSSLRIARRLATGAQSPVRLTFNNVRTLDELSERIARNMAFSSADFVKACSDVLPGYGFDDSRQYPAAFLPDTYEVYWSESAEGVVEKLVKHRNAFWNDERRGKAQALGLTPVKVATLASIVEEETGKRDERPTVARLYLNRLAKGMKLQADPTVKFALGDFSLRRILKEHLGVNSPYNTYVTVGLPPGPIRIADASTLDAVLDAPKHSFIYMCAREDFSGYHNFATDYSTHMANARRYQAELNRRNIK